VLVFLEDSDCRQICQAVDPTLLKNPIANSLRAFAQREAMGKNQQAKTSWPKSLDATLEERQIKINAAATVRAK
jgi:hypothetical protein